MIDKKYYQLRLELLIDLFLFIVHRNDSSQMNNLLKIKLLKFNQLEEIEIINKKAR